MIQKCSALLAILAFAIAALAQTNLTPTLRIGASKIEEFEYWQAMASRGAVESIYKLGVCYENGTGTKIDYDKASQCFLNAASRNHLPSIYAAAVILQKTKPQQSFALYSQGASLGSMECASFLGYAYDAGHEPVKDQEGIFKGYEMKPRLVPVNYHEARKWYFIAAAKGSVGALNSLGVMYWFGEGGPQDQIEAYRCWRMASKKDSEIAIQNIKIANKYLSQAIIQEAIRRAEIPLTNSVALRTH